jgi:hypothetical protein
MMAIFDQIEIIALMCSKYLHSCALVHEPGNALPFEVVLVFSQKRGGNNVVYVDAHNMYSLRSFYDSS